MTTLKKTPPNTWSSRVHDFYHPNPKLVINPAGVTIQGVSDLSSELPENIPDWNDVNKSNLDFYKLKMPTITFNGNPYSRRGQLFRKLQHVYTIIKDKSFMSANPKKFSIHVRRETRRDDDIKHIRDILTLNKTDQSTVDLNTWDDEFLNDVDDGLDSYLQKWENPESDQSTFKPYTDKLPDREKTWVDTVYKNVGEPLYNKVVTNGPQIGKWIDTNVVTNGPQIGKWIGTKVQSILSRPRLPTVRPHVLTDAEEDEKTAKLSQLEFEKRNQYQAELLNAVNHLNSRSTVTNLNYMPHLRTLHPNDKLGLDKMHQAELDKRSPTIGRPQSNSDNPLDPLSTYSAKSIITQSNINNNQISQIFLEITPVLIELCYVNSMIANHYTGKLRDINNAEITLANINKAVNKFKKDFKEKASQIYKLNDIYATVNEVQWKTPFDGQNYKNLYTNSTDLLKLNTLSDIDKESCKFVINTLDDLKSQREQIVFPMFNIKQNYDVSKKNISILIKKLTSVMELDPRISIYNIIDKITPIFIAESNKSTKVNHPKYGNHGCDMGFCVRNFNAVRVDRRTVNALFYIPYNDNISKHLWIDDFAVDNFIDDNGIIIPRMRDYYNVGYLLNDKALHQLGNDIEFHQSGGKSKKSKKSNKSRKSRKSRK